MCSGPTTLGAIDRHHVHIGDSRKLMKAATLVALGTVAFRCGVRVLFVLVNVARHIPWKGARLVLVKLGFLSFRLAAASSSSAILALRSETVSINSIRSWRGRRS